VTFEAEVYMTL